MHRSDDPGGVELRFSILSIYARGLAIVEQNSVPNILTKKLVCQSDSFWSNLIKH